MNEARNNPVRTPGEMVLGELERKGWTQNDLAKVLDKSPSRITEIIQGKMSISTELALELESAFGINAEEWLRAETALSLSKVRKPNDAVKRRARIYEIAPVKELQKRGWISNADNPEQIEKELLEFYDIKSVDESPSIHGAMRKTGNTQATPTQMAWAFKVRKVAAQIPRSSVDAYKESNIQDLKVKLRKLAAFSQETKRIPKLLMSYGIRFVIVEGLGGEKLDGFATWLDESSPVIGMSLRRDKLDIFWFTLGHELAHIFNKDEAPVDCDVNGEDILSNLEVRPEFERRADKESAELFIDPDELDSFIKRTSPLYSMDRINQFANRIKMHPQIIIGQLKHKTEIPQSHFNKNTIRVRELVATNSVKDGWDNFDLQQENVP